MQVVPLKMKLGKKQFIPLERNRETKRIFTTDFEISDLETLHKIVSVAVFLAKERYKNLTPHIDPDQEETENDAVNVSNV